ncbi:unnamed protein product [Adineta steineri]|uniref:Macro domain-containing protein n=1 Tax=Adineta steineri TaxID=433720 RepID=A0A818JTF8_9BILA|nr:unnamed protein product [Adineta steineri]CAF3547203.1 unnamed protein product [Adineta steineri]
MATAIDLTYEILRIFSDSHRNEMTLIELHTILANQIKRLTTDEVLRTLRSTNLSNLFSIQFISNDVCLIQLNPKLTLCEACLQKSCKKMNCTKLHLCCYVSHFSNKPLEKPCLFPHTLRQHPNNIVLLKKFQYDTLDQDLLLNLLRFYHRINNNEQSQPRQYTNSKRPTSSQNNMQSKSANYRMFKSRPPSQLKKSPIIIIDNVTERQLDISIPSERDAPDVDLEIVQLVLATKDIIVERTLEKQISNDFYRRFTLQFKDKQVVDKVLQTEPIIVYNNVPIKMKRTVRQKDSKIFALKFNVNKKIDDIRLNLYIETLIGKINSNVFDMTPDGNNEQIYLIRCEQSIDFDHLYKVHSAKNTLQGYTVTITEVYEAQTIEVSLLHRSLHQSMNVKRLRQLFGETRWQQDVFACTCIHDENTADIELMNAEVTANWLAEANRMEQDLSLSIHPIIDFIQPLEKNEKQEDEEENDEEISKILSSRSKISSPLSPVNRTDTTSTVDNDSGLYTIKPNWRIVLTHPTFGDEYRKYIREHMNISVQITGSTIQVPNEYVRKELARYTNMFIQTFVFQEVTNPSKAEVKLIKDNYTRMTHKWQADTNKTLIAARREVMNELFPRPNSTITRPQNRTPATPAFRYKQSPILKKQTPIEESIPDQSQMKTTENSLCTLPYTIENTVYFPFFSLSNPFANRLSTYLLNTFDITLDIKPVSPTKLVLDLKGQSNDVNDARSALTALFASLKTKTYPDNNDDSKFTIPDIYRVVQWNLDQNSIVSSCSYSPKNGGLLLVRYFANNPQFGVDEQKIDDIIHHNIYAIVHQILITTKTLEKHLEELQTKIQQKSDYGQNICCLYNYSDKNRLFSIHLCGTKTIVDDIYSEVKKIIDEYAPVPCNIQLPLNQVNFLLQICSAELIRFEKQHEIDGVDLRSGLKCDKTSQFLAPKYLHEKIKVFLLEMSQIQMASKDFQCSVQLFKTKKNEINTLALKNRCLLSISLSSQPKASSRVAGTATSTAISVSNGDLITEQSDVLVICSSSAKLRDVMIKAAGNQVEQELNGKDLTKNMVDTSAGQLKQAKRLLFLPWQPPSSYTTNQDIAVLRQSIALFIQQAIKYAIQGKFQSIAFPAIGCGGFGIPPDVIATIMIDEVREQLIANPTIQLMIKFVVQQSHVYDVFNAKLKPTSTTGASRNRSPSPSHLLTQEKVNITLTTTYSNIDKARNLLDTIGNILV